MFWDTKSTNPCTATSLYSSMVVLFKASTANKDLVFIEKTWNVTSSNKSATFEIKLIGTACQLNARNLK